MFELYTDSFRNQYETFPDNKVFRLTYDSVVSLLRLISKRQDLLEEIRKSFSIDNPGAFFSKQYGFRSQQRLYAINKFGYFQSGLIYNVLNWIKLHYGDLQLVAISKNCKKYIDEQLTPLKDALSKQSHFEISNISDDTGRNAELEREGKNQFKFRDYQEESIEKLIFTGFGRGLIEIPTAGGKSFILANFIWNILKHIDRHYKFLILVPNTQLVEQFYYDLIDYGYSKFEIARMRGGMSKYELQQNDIKNAKIIISNRQYLFKNKDLLPKIDCLICDEVHTTLADSTAEFIQHLECSLKIGCTGTIPKDMYKQWNMIGMFGRVVFTKEIVDLQEQGFISKLKITLLDIFDRQIDANRHLLFNMNSFDKYSPDENGFSDVAFNDAYNSEIEFFKNNYERMYTPALEYANKLNENILVLFDRIEIGISLFDLGQKLVTSKTSYYIDGSVPVEEREQIRSKFESSGNNILFAQTSTFATGINIKRLNHVMFCFNTKSFSRILQAIGRTLRLHKSKSEAHLIDIKMNTKYSDKHYRERLKYYKESYHKMRPDETIKIVL